MYVLNCHVWPVVNIATTRDQYVGLKLVVLSTRMKVMGEDEIVGMTRWMRTMFVDADAASTGVNTPSSRNVFTLAMRRREEAEGDNKMMGSRRLVGLRWRLETRGVLCGWDWGLVFGSEEGRLRRKVAAILR